MRALAIAGALLTLSVAAAEKVDTERLGRDVLYAEQQYKACIRVWAAAYAPAKESPTDVIEASVQQCDKPRIDLFGAVFLLLNNGKNDAVKEAEEFVAGTEKNGRKEAMRVLFETRYPALKCCSPPSPPSQSR